MNRTPEELQAASSHVHYELTMLLASMQRHVEIMLSDGDIAIRNALLESFSVHLRNLAEFLYAGKPRPDDIVAAQFYSPQGGWEKIRPAKPKTLDDHVRRANKKIAHLTFERLQPKNPDGEWPITAATADLVPVIHVWAINAPVELLSSNWTEGEDAFRSMSKRDLMQSRVYIRPWNNFKK